MEATCRLTPDCRHHEVQMGVAVNLLQQGALRLHERVVQLPLRRRKIHFNRLRLARGELPDVTPSRAVDEACKRVQRLDPTDDGDPLSKIQTLRLQVSVDCLELRT